MYLKVAMGLGVGHGMQLLHGVGVGHVLEVEHGAVVGHGFGLDMYLKLDK